VVIGSLGFLLLVTSLDGLLAARENYAQTSRVATLTAISEPLFKMLVATRLERATMNSVLITEAAIDATGEGRIKTFRSTAEENYHAAMERLDALKLPELATDVANLRAAHDALAIMRPKADAAAHLPKLGRDPAVIRDEPNVYTAFFDKVVAMGDTVEGTLKLVDPVVDQLLSIKRAAWWMRAFGGSVSLRTELAVAKDQPWSQADILATADEQARILLASSILDEAAARADTPKPLVDAIGSIKRGYLSFMNGDQKTYIAALSAGQKLNIPIHDLQQRDTEVLVPIVDTAYLALDTMVDRAESQRRAAEFRLGIDGAMLAAAVLFTTCGLLVASRRISGPIRAMTDAMRALAGRNFSVEIPGIGRGDEIGAMAAAVQVFRDEMTRSAELSAEAEAHKAAEAQRERQAAAEREAVAAQQAEVVEALAGALAQLADGNLTVTLQQKFSPEYARLRDDFNEAVSGLHAALREIMMHSQAIGSGTQKIAVAADDLARRTEQQAAGLQQTAAALDEVTATVRHTAEGSARAQKIAGTAKSDVETSGKVVNETVAAMSAIEGSARQIGQIIGVIDEIAFQTNLLALNAGVEAARAGESGRGFAVVAQEVRALAQRAADAAKEIKALVTNSMQQVERGVRLVGATGEALVRIQTGVADINIAISEIAASAAAQATGLAEVNSAVNQMDQTTKQNAAMVEQSTAATHSLASETEALNHAVERFRIDESARPSHGAEQYSRTG
jgi:methyl-accepting chemotaxis protein